MSNFKTKALTYEGEREEMIIEGYSLDISLHCPKNSWWSDHGQIKLLFCTSNKTRVKDTSL